MPQKRNSAGPPPTMTWSKALPVIAVAGVLDLVRMFFEMFWFFGPALAALYCTAKVSGVVSTVTFGLLGLKTAAVVCTGAAAAGGAALSELTTPFGVIMAMAFGFAGFLILGMWLLMTNARMFTVNRSSMFLLAGSLGASEIPFIGAFPAFSVTLWVLYRRQIKAETAALKRWEKEQAAAQRQEREQQAAQLIQYRDAQLAQAEVQEAANEEQYEEEIPEEVHKAA